MESRLGLCPDHRSIALREPMSPIIQNSLVALFIMVASLYVARRSWLSLRGQSGGCGIGCNSCPSNKQNDQVLVELSDFRANKR